MTLPASFERSQMFFCLRIDRDLEGSARVSERGWTMSRIEGGIQPLEASDQGCATAFLLYDFEVGSSQLKSLHKGLLERLAEILARNPEHKARLVGRASRTGTDAVDMKLSRQRAEAVAKFLRDHKVTNDQIVIEFIGKSSPFGTGMECPEDRSVEVHMQIAKVLTLVLEGAHFVRPTHELVKAIREVLEPIVRQAGRELKIVQQRILPRDGELTITFDPGGGGTRLCGVRILGQDAGGVVFVGAHKAMRVCGGITGDPDDPGGLNHDNQIEPIFDNGQPEFARFVANTTIHELGHIMAKLEHSSDRFNYMSNEDLPADLRTRENLVKFYSGRLRFEPTQINRLVCATQTGNFAGGLPELTRTK